MKHLILLLFFWQVTLFVYAQQVDLTPEPIDNDNYSEARVIGQDDDGFYILQSNLSLDLKKNRVGLKSRKLKVTCFDGSLKQKWTKPAISTSDNGIVDQVVYAFDHLLMVSSVESKNEAAIEIWIQQFDNRGTAPGPGNRIATFPIDRSSDREKCLFVYSAGMKHAMVILKENTDDGKQVIHTALLDSMLMNLRNRAFTIPYSQKEFTFEDYKLSDDGDLAILGFLNRKEKDQEGEKVRINEYHLFIAAAREEKMREHPVKAGLRSLAQAGLVIDNHHKRAVVMGFYADKNSMTGTGIFSATCVFDEIDGFEVKTNSMDGTHHRTLIGERNSNNSGGITNYPVQKIILRNDGGAVIIAEAAYLSEYSYYDYFTQSLVRHTDYHFDNIILISVNKDCTVDWSSVIRKRQESTDDGGIFSSFSMLLNSDELIIIYNRDIDRNLHLYAEIITNRGEQKELNITKSADHLTMLPTWGKQVSENEIIIPAYQKKRLHLAKISF